MPQAKNARLHCIISSDCYIGGLITFPRGGLRGANCVSSDAL